MDTKTLLKEINSLHNYIRNLDEIGSVSAIDQAILKSRLEKLYEYVISDYFDNPLGDLSSLESIEIKRPPIEEEKSSIPAPPEPAEKAIDRSPEPTIEKKPDPIFFFEKEEEPEVSENSSQEEHIQVAHEAGSPFEKVQAPAPQTVKVSSTNIVHEEPVSAEILGTQVENGDYSSSVDPELERLFEIKYGNELSDRLSATPIKDIFRAMGLNERIFTQNELFGGSSEIFRQTVERLNGFTTFAEAKSYLQSTIAQEYNWHNSERREIAHNFVQLVHRRYKDKI